MEGTMTVGANVYNVGYDYQPMKHSGLGVASFIMAMVLGVLDFAIFVYAGLVEAGTPGGMDEESVVAILLGLFIIGSVFANVAGIALGIAGAIQRDRQKVFSILGVIFNSAIIFGMIGLIIIGLMMPA
jgi:hypothetical protein